MLPSLLADALLLIHFLFVLFVVFGGLIALYRRWLAWLHVPTFVWAALINILGWTCPLTPLEQSLRIAAGETGYEGGFVEHYIAPLVYYEATSGDFGVKLGLAVLLWNLAVYAVVIVRLRRST
jgi:hypothetical protein